MEAVSGDQRMHCTGPHGHCYVRWTLFPGAAARWSSFGAGTIVFFVSLIGPGSVPHAGQKLTLVE